MSSSEQIEHAAVLIRFEREKNARGTYRQVGAVAHYAARVEEGIELKAVENSRLVGTRFERRKNQKI